MKSNETLYWSYESFVKRAEGALGSTVGATGAVYAVRRTLVRTLPTDTVVMDDLLQSLHVVASGKRFAYESTARAYESPARFVSGEMNRRVRIGAGNIASIKPYLSLLHPRNGFVALSLFSHKILRWSLPFILVAMLAATALLSFRRPVDPWVVGAWCVVCVWFLLGWYLDRRGRQGGFMGLLYYFVAINFGLGRGILLGLFGTQTPSWSKVARSDKGQEEQIP